MGPIEKKLSGFRYFRIHKVPAHHIAKKTWAAITVLTVKLRDVGQAGVVALRPTATRNEKELNL
jgi:hypothetical protein